METEGIYRSHQSASSLDGSKRESFEEGGLKPPPYTPFDNSSSVDVKFWILIGFSQLAGFTCIGLIAYYSKLAGGFSWSNNNLLFNYHPFLLVLGLIFFYGDAILVYRVLYFLPKWILKWIHTGLHLSALVLSSVGIAAIFENHRRKGPTPNEVRSLHSWMGIAAFGLFCLQYVVSFIAFLFPGLPGSIRGKIMPLHTFCGFGIFLMAVAAAEMGMVEKIGWGFGSFKLPVIIGQSLGVFLVVFAFFVVFTATRSKYKRKPLPSDTPAPTN